MNDIERVKALRDAGHITPEEAERLIGVLGELDGAGDASPTAATPTEAPVPQPDATATPREAPVPQPDATATPSMTGAVPRASVATPTPEPTSGAAPSPASAPAPGAPAAAIPAAGPSRPAAVADPAALALAPAGTKWCTLVLTAADLTVRADDVAEPVVEADPDHQLEITPTPEGLRVTSRRGLSIEGWFGRLSALDVDVRLPRDWGLDLDQKAGDATVRGVRYVRGRMLAGDLEVHDAHAVDLSKAAGDLEVSFRPTEGRHRIVGKAGDVDVRLLEGSDASIEASLTIGDLTARGLQVERRTVGADARGVVGNGRAHVEVRLTAGDLDIRLPRGEG